MANFGIREVADVTLRALRNIPACRSMTGREIRRGEPVVYFDYLQVSSLSGSDTTVEARGGRGNPRLLSWSGDKEITFTVESALISPASLALLTAASKIDRQVAKVELIVPDNNIGIFDANTFNNTIFLTQGYDIGHYESGNQPTDDIGYDHQRVMSWGRVRVTVARGAGADLTASPGTTAYFGDLNNIDLDSTSRVETEHTVMSRDIEVLHDGNGEYRLVITGLPGAIVEVNQLLILKATEGRTVKKHERFTVTATQDGQIALPERHQIVRNSSHPMFVFKIQDDGSMDLINEIGLASGAAAGSPGFVANPDGGGTIHHASFLCDSRYMVDYYREVRGNTTSLVIRADASADYYRLEGLSAMKRKSDGQDVPVQLTMPRVRPQGTFEIPFNASGDPATFSFEFDVYPGEHPSFPNCDDIMVVIDILSDDEDDCNCVFDDAPPVECD